MLWQDRLQYSSKLILLALSHDYLTAKAYDTGFLSIKQWLPLYIRKSTSIKTHSMILHK